MSFKVEFTPYRLTRTKTRWSTCRTQTSTRCTWLTPGSEDSESLARQKWQRFTDC